ncbi:MAG: DNA mismatch repair endonuclease MutL [Microscillaceae bacterium]|nr:DNA mismatch repair endonuclease MutL [Microscillaceae bacterium]MDW8460748.1 DNA mismatch repair endonuclease MutL [Cytophagales bacterium]
MSQGDIIQLLPDSVANQIAAGEVVQRPASVVKELLENSVDAQAKNIKLVVKEAGKTFIQVIDDGIGMSETDARMSFERHATSKIRKAEDLFQIHTMGFRGEALASIAAVAQVEMKTRREMDLLGTFLQIEGSVLQKQEPIACNKGTVVTVKNLFFNVPARKNFLKSNPLEMRHIVEEFIKVALANTTINFTLWNANEEIFHLQAGKLHQRIIQIFGSSYKNQLVPCQEQTPFLSIHGYIGKPEFAKKTRGEQYFFVNQRFIRNAYLHNAVLKAYDKLIPTDTHPFYVLFLKIDPKHIDINIHPTKTEIKFDDERTIYALLQATVRNALAAHNLMPSIDFETNADFSIFSIQHLYPTINNSTENIYTEKNYRNKNQANANYTQQNYNLQNWKKVYEHLQQQAPETENTQESFILESKVNTMNNPTKSYWQWIGEKDFLQVLQNFILLRKNENILLIRQDYALERIFYEKIIKSIKNNDIKTQKILFPNKIALSYTDFDLIAELANDIQKLGFEFELQKPNFILITGIPNDAIEGNEKELLENLLEQYRNATLPQEQERHIVLAQSFAKRLAKQKTTEISTIELQTLLSQLFATQNPNYTPDGNKIFTYLTESFFTNLLL